MKQYTTLIKVGLVIALAAVVYAIGYSHGSSREQVAAVQGQNQAITRSVEVSRGVRTDREEKRAERRVEAQKQGKEVERAIQDNPDWADMPVPDSVWDALGGK